MINVLTNKTKDTIVIILNDFFRERSGMTPIVKYSFPMEARTYPIITISTSNGNYKSSGIGMDFYDDVKDQCGYTTAYRHLLMSTMNVNIKVTAMTTEERQRLIDEVIVALFYVKRDTLYSNGIRILNWTLGGEETADVNQATKEFSSTVVLSVFTETFLDEVVEHIKAIDVRRTGPTTANWPDLECEP